VPGDGTLLQEAGKRTVFLVVAGARFPIDPALLDSLGLSRDSVRYVCRGGLSRIGSVPPGGTVLEQTVPHSVLTFVSGSADGSPDIKRLYSLLTSLALGTGNSQNSSKSEVISGLPSCGPRRDLSPLP
jgi:hypothetical protein